MQLLSIIYGAALHHRDIFPDAFCLKTSIYLFCIYFRCFIFMPGFSNSIYKFPFLIVRTGKIVQKCKQTFPAPFWLFLKCCWEGHLFSKNALNNFCLGRQLKKLSFFSINHETKDLHPFKMLSHKLSLFATPLALQ